MNADTSDLIDLSPRFAGRVMLTLGQLTVTRSVSASANDLPEAKRRVDYMLAQVWGGWKVTFVSPLQEVKR